MPAPGRRSARRPGRNLRALGIRDYRAFDTSSLASRKPAQFFDTLLFGPCPFNRRRGVGQIQNADID